MRRKLRKLVNQKVNDTSVDLETFYSLLREASKPLKPSPEKPESKEG